MADAELLKTERVVALPDSKWVVKVSTAQPVYRVAARVLHARLNAVCQALPLAAEKSDEDVEHVHRLRIAVRRAVAAVRVFGRLIAKDEIDALREQLRRIRRAADEARNWDIMAQRFTRDAGTPPAIVAQIQARRRDAQTPIVAIHQEVTADACAAKIAQLVQDVKTRCQGPGKRRFGRQPPTYLAPVVKQFFKAAESALGTDESLHVLRIRTKKLRYTMELVAVAFDAAFRKKLYQQVTLFQDLLGTINDHATAKQLFGDWLSHCDDGEQRAFLSGVLLAEERANDDLRAAFLATRTPKALAKLRRQFQAYC